MLPPCRSLSRRHWARLGQTPFLLRLCRRPCFDQGHPCPTTAQKRLTDGAGAWPSAQPDVSICLSIGKPAKEGEFQVLALRVKKSPSLPGKTQHERSFWLNGCQWMAVAVSSSLGVHHSSAARLASLRKARDAKSGPSRANQNSTDVIPLLMAHLVSPATVETSIFSMSVFRLAWQVLRLICRWRAISFAVLPSAVS